MIIDIKKIGMKFAVIITKHKITRPIIYHMLYIVFYILKPI